MPTNNPYQAPSADMSSQQSDATYQPKVFTHQGRIGRLRYLAYSLAPTLLMLPVFMIAGVLAGMMGSGDQDPMASGIFLVIAGAAYLFIIVFSFIFAKRRFNDMDQSGWLSLLMLIPLVNLIVGLVLIFAPGTPTSNKYGLRPGHNTMWVQIGAFALPVIAILGILAAIAIPAYSDYAERARQAESQYSE